LEKQKEKGMEGAAQRPQKERNRFLEDISAHLLTTLHLLSLQQPHGWRLVVQPIWLEAQRGEVACPRHCVHLPASCVAHRVINHTREVRLGFLG
jgi:hypothetical protein